VRKKIPVLILCNKTDKVTAHTKEFIRRQMEKEMYAFKFHIFLFQFTLSIRNYSMISFYCPVDNIYALSLCWMEHIHIHMSMLLLLLIGSYWRSILYFLLITLIFEVSFTYWSVCLDFENVHCYLFLIYDNLIVSMISLSILLLTLHIIIFQRQIAGIKKCDIRCWRCKWVHPGGTGWAIFFYPVL